GAQPTCPCGTIHHVGHEPLIGWTDPEHLTVDYWTDYDWPMSPNVKVGGDGRVHAFWHQLGSGSMLDPRLKTLEYWVGENGVWTDEGSFLDNHEVSGLGEKVALNLTPDDKPIFAWAHKDTIGGQPQPRAIWLARPWAVTDVPGDGIPSRQLALEAHPNPFNPRTTLTYTLPRESSVQLFVYDVSGRLVRRLEEGVRAAGPHTVTWDGRNEHGREVNSGFYLGRINADGIARTVKLTLVR
ncbi:MAG: T9SS type A sorting domain-containing protein, partial [Gammaproteobacteria bacterium]|nr:T9SS type A sorting domain-containing protein [Gammaproteobacteria bacterium]